MTAHDRERDAHARGGNDGHFDMHATARRALRAEGFEPDIPAAAQQQVDRIAGPAGMEPGVRDLRDKPWSSIDNTESRDLDQVEYAEGLPNGAIRIVVGIADVDALV